MEESNHELVGGQVLVNVHDSRLCVGRNCPVHNPSEHHMKDFPQNFREDTGVMERICPHGIGHPDPDHMVWAKSVGLDWHGVHGCDLCCLEPKEIS